MGTKDGMWIIFSNYLNVPIDIHSLLICSFYYWLILAEKCLPVPKFMYIHTYTYAYTHTPLHCVVLKLGLKQMMGNHFFTGTGIKKRSTVTLTAMT